MIVMEQGPVPDAALPVDRFREHLRLGTGFADDGAQDAVLKALLRAALAAVEARTGKALLARSFTFAVDAWREADRQALPVAPVTAILSVVLLDRAGEVHPVDADTYVLRRDTHRPQLAAVSGALPVVPLGGSAEIAFEAGFGADWAQVPADLAQAVMLLAAHYHEHRHEAALGDGGMPFGVMELVERWRTVRILAGGGVR
ncbi:hypothetical protein EJA01_09595 [Rhodovulum iodosum]|nr:hypothetical protein [Rhodovulum robiginosum]RSK33660.1 hypothetical protein EJA01_09595 [Rhodovulum robiginosum]